MEYTTTIIGRFAACAAVACALVLSGCEGDQTHQLAQAPPDEAVENAGGERAGSLRPLAGYPPRLLKAPQEFAPTQLPLESFRGEGGDTTGANRQRNIPTALATATARQPFAMPTDWDRVTRLPPVERSVLSREERSQPSPGELQLGDPRGDRTAKERAAAPPREGREPTTADAAPRYSQIPRPPAQPVQPTERLPQLKRTPTPAKSASLRQGDGSTAFRRSSAPVVDRQLQVLSAAVRSDIQAAISLAGRGAVFAARADLVAALRRVALALDTRDRSDAHTQALARAMTALEEVRDFDVAATRLADAESLSRTIESHSTPVLKGAPLDGVTTIAAARAYLGYAQRQLVAASGRVPAAGEALFAMAKIDAARAARKSAAAQAGPQVMTLYQAALLVNPRQYRAANELGVLLARYGQLEDARRVLRHSVSLAPRSENWYNLAVVHQRLGEKKLAELAMQEAKKIGAGSPARRRTRAAAPEVDWIPPGRFASHGPPRQLPRRQQAARPQETKPEEKKEPGGINRWLPWK